MSDESTRIDKATFCRTYIPMARNGKTALEIGKALGVDKLEGKDTDAAISQFVCQKASNYRKELKVEATVAAKVEVDNQKPKLTKKQAAEFVAEFVAEAVAKLPKLTTRTRSIADFGAFLDEILAECDSEEEVTDTPE